MFSGAGAGVFTLTPGGFKKIQDAIDNNEVGMNLGVMHGPHDIQNPPPKKEKKEEQLVPSHESPSDIKDGIRDLLKMLPRPIQRLIPGVGSIQELSEKAEAFAKEKMPREKSVPATQLTTGLSSPVVPVDPAMLQAKRDRKA